MSLYHPKAVITKTVATWLIILPYEIGPMSHKASCIGITKTVATWLIILPYAIGPMSHKASWIL
jgi:hypothetical protein